MSSRVGKVRLRALGSAVTLGATLRAGPAALLGAGVIATILIIVLQWQAGTAGRDLGSLVLACLAMLCAVTLLRSGMRDEDADHYRVHLGTGMLIIAIGSLVSATITVWWGRPAPNLGDYLQVCCLPSIALGLASIPGRTFEPSATVRFVLEGLMLGSFLSLLWWRGLITLSNGQFVPDQIRAGVNAVYLIIVALIVIVMIQAPSRGVLLAGVGGIVVSAADIFTTVLLAAGRSDAIVVVVLALAWPVMTVGLLFLSAWPAELSERQSITADARRYVVVSTFFFALVAASVWLIFIDRRLDPMTALLFFVGMFALWARELVRAGQLTKMLDQMRTLAHRDPLTGLGNRRALEDELRDCRRQHGQLSVLTIDLDGFKSVNDQLGHEAGDHLLMRVAGLVDFEAKNIHARAFRVGGDEFVVVSRASPEEAVEAAQRIVDGTELEGVVGGSHAMVSVGASVGVLHRVLEGYTPMADLLADLGSAGTAMRTAKREGAGRVVIYDERLASRSRRRFDVEKRLAQAVADSAITVRFQPIISLRTGLVAGVEALARWSDSELGDVRPQEFVRVAEECGLIRELGDQILRTALRGAVASGLIGRGLSVSINVSTIQLRAPGFDEVVAQVLGDLEVPASQLTIEVTESIFVRTDDPAIRTLLALADLGVRMSLDDFGTGYSSIGYLTRLPVRALKLDRTMTMRLGESSIWAIARSVVEMAAALGLDVVIEGVETAHEEADARRLGVDLAQGWYYADALSVTQLTALLLARDGRRMN